VTIVDAQLHEPAVSLEWDGVDEAVRRLALTELQVGYMRAVGVDRAVINPIDLGWAESAAALFPGRFGIVPLIVTGGAIGAIDPTAADVEALIAAQAAKPAIVGMRILPTTPTGDGGHSTTPLATFDRAVAACEREGLPLFVYTLDYGVTAAIAERHPELTVIVDHLGMAQPPISVPEEPRFASLPDLLALARFPNVAVKVSAVPTLSRERYPFADLWPHLQQIVETYGADRLMWGSDISRVYGRCGFLWRIPAGEGDYEGKHTYAEALLYLRETDRLTAEDKELILGGTALALLRWDRQGV
jgi:predicted TIM-barrel fold metal-dependent hydrolase